MLPKLKLSFLLGVICLASIVSLAVKGISQSPGASVSLTTRPSEYQIKAFEAESHLKQTPVLITIQANDGAGQPLTDAKIDLTIFTPQKTPWFTTDFPIVEGTKLLEISSVARAGKLDLEQILPIRGTYRLLVNVTPTIEDTFLPFQQNITLDVGENWLKYRNFLILAIILLSVGLIGGFTIGGQQKILSGEVAPQNVRLLLSGLIIVSIILLLFINISAEIAQSKMSMPASHLTKHIPKSNKSDILMSPSRKAEIIGDSTAIVGTTSQFQIKIVDEKTGQLSTNIIFRVRVIHLEKNLITFAYNGIGSAEGQLKWEQEFFDASPHKIEVEFFPVPNTKEQFKPFTIEKEIEVEGVAPPLLTRLISLGYLTGIVAIGVLIGMKTKQAISVD